LSDTLLRISNVPKIRYRPSPRECALLLLALIADKEEENGKQHPRLRVSEMTLRRLWLRQRLHRALVDDVAEWLLYAGRALFFAGDTYAIASTAAVAGWPRISSKRLAAQLDEVAQGRFDFETLEHLLESDTTENGDE
jgi:hypothetical protein